LKNGERSIHKAINHLPEPAALRLKAEHLMWLC
jgi:hypothetical protein